MTDRKINSLFFSNAQKTKLRAYFSEQTGRKYKSITDITKEVNTVDKNPERTYELLRDMYNDSIDAQRKKNKSIKSKETRAAKKLAIKTPVLMDHTYTKIEIDRKDDYGDKLTIRTLNRNVFNDLQILSKKLVGVSTFYVQLFGQGTILHNKYTDPETIFWEVLEPFFYERGSDPQESDCKIFTGLYVGQSTRVVVLLSDTIIPEKLQQKYRDGGEKHCVIEPIYNLFMSYADNSVSKESKKKLLRTAAQIKRYEFS